MGYIDSHLLPDETIAYRAHLHWRMFFWTLVLVVMGLAILTLMGSAVGLLLVGLGIIAVAPRWVDYTSSEFAVTNRRVMIKRGVLRRSTFDLRFDKIEAVFLKQKGSERIIDCGSVTIRGTGGTWRTTPKISAPSEFHKQIQTHLT